MYANVIIDISHEKTDRTFQYLIPDSLLEQIYVGCKVFIPFGKGNTQRTGYVISITDRAEYPPDKMKSLIQLCPASVGVQDRLIRLASFIRNEYGSTMYDALRTVLPVKKVTKAVEHRTIHAAVSDEELRVAQFGAQAKKRNAQARLLQALREMNEIDYRLVVSKLNVSGPTIESLVKKGLIRVEKSFEYRNPIRWKTQEKEPVNLNERQREIAEAICMDYRNQSAGVHLIHGVTGSGKTEVYMEVIAECLARGKQAIMLIPEISLTYQTVVRFYRRFGDRVSVMHSKLSDGERYDQFERARNGEVSVMIGPRSALFTPFENLGLIIIDEEHETTYKSENMPKYHAREVAIFLGKENNAPVILGSATPSLASYYKALRGEYTLHKMQERAVSASLANVEIVDLRKEFAEGNKSIFSRVLQDKIEDRLEKGEQIMLFLNRRGYSSFISCRTCGEVIKCPHCDVSLAEHKDGSLNCHYCGYTQPKVQKCPACQSPNIAGFKAGTQQIEEMIHKRFPIATVLRMDADTTKHKDDYDAILSKFSNREADILLGTQMIVKGHDFPGVTLMGILAADLSLACNDYRAGERTFQLLVQAAGRAGRGELAGDVIVQTYQPDHYAITLAAEQDYEAFYEEEMTYRELLEYPPAATLLAVQLTGPDEGAVEKLALALAESVKRNNAGSSLQLIGPAKASLSKKSDLYRRVIYLKHKNANELIRVRDEMEQYLTTLELKKESVQFDYNPLHLF